MFFMRLEARDSRLQLNIFTGIHSKFQKSTLSSIREGRVTKDTYKRHRHKDKGTNNDKDNSIKVGGRNLMKFETLEKERIPRFP